MSVLTQTDPKRVQEAEYEFPYHYLTLLSRISWTFRLYNYYRTEIVALIRSLHPRHALEIGCGDGRLCYELTHAGVPVTGMDISPRAIAFARAFVPGASFTVGDITQEVPRGDFDLAIMMEVLEHIEPVQLSRVIAHVHASLAADGCLVVTVPSATLPVSAKHFQHFTAETLAATLQPWFRIERLLGMLKQGLRYRLYMCLQAGDYALGGLRRNGNRLVRPYYRLLDTLIAQIGYCDPDHATQLVAVCRKLRPDRG